MNKHLVLFFTHDVSIKTWVEMGMFDREIKPYKHLAKAGWTIDFVTYGDSSDLDWAEAVSPIRILPCYGKKRPSSKVWRILASPLVLWHHRGSLRKASIYKSNQLWGGWNAILAKVFFRGKVIIRCGYEYLSFSRSQQQPAHFQMIAWLVEWFCYRFADQIVMATRSDFEFVLEVFPFTRRKKVAIQPNWVDEHLFKPVPRGKFLEADLVYIGRGSAQKNLPALFDAVNRIGVSLDVYGSIQTHKNLAGEYKRIRFMGPIKNSKIPQIMSRYNAFILPSLFEGNPKVLLEAMSCGAKVIATAVPGIKDIIKHEYNGFLGQPDPCGIAEVITQALSSERPVGVNARKDILKKFSYRKFMIDEMNRLENLL